jgi:nanoRNase/pAp phosphatase (c-di-AMP/oligoRNAs hydrolase)
LEPKTSEERYVYKRYEEIEELYQEVLKEGLKLKNDDPFVYVYKEGSMTFGGDLGREIPYRIQGKKMYIIAREKAGRMLCSLRSNKIDLVKFLENALKKVDGYGGGHPVAAGCNINKDDFEKFIELAREA